MQGGISRKAQELLRFPSSRFASSVIISISTQQRHAKITARLFGRARRNLNCLKNFKSWRSVYYLPYPRRRILFTIGMCLAFLNVSVVSNTVYTPSLGGQGTFKALPFLDPLLASCPDRIPLRPNVPRRMGGYSMLWANLLAQLRVQEAAAIVNTLVPSRGSQPKRGRGYVADNNYRNPQYLLIANFKVDYTCNHGCL